MKMDNFLMTTARELMIQFSEDTGLTSNTLPRRYLWTDAFAVCNFLGLCQTNKEEKFKDIAIKLVNQVHRILGQHRTDDERTGWLGSQDHPTKNGLRIGKSLNERKPHEPYDFIREWDRDGQYFHYLTKWMHTLIRVYQVVNEEKYLHWAVDLAQASTAFISDSRMYWKMSIDLSYPLVPSMGEHDPIDGYTTFKELQTFTDVDLEEEIKKFEKMMQQLNFITIDPLGIGGQLSDAYRLKQLDADPELSQGLINAAQKGLELSQLSHGLAFRELGLAIGLQAAQKMDVLEKYWSLIEEINQYWLKHCDWTEHIDINRVMLATSLAPESFLSISD
ncbi:MAG: hypothetical protein JSW11_14945 [Candidatus Heimdallarchaeota archaeon]|nr:MAG: hypothetical protein JSW11_14945 [Candidatus Heimdallarchaeota archaeon]